MRAQSGPLTEQIREIINEVRSISKVVIEFMQAISQPKLALMQTLKKAITNSVDPEIKHQYNSLKKSEKLVTEIEAVRNKLEQLSTNVVKAMKELTSSN